MRHHYRSAVLLITAGAIALAGCGGKSSPGGAVKTTTPPPAVTVHIARPVSVNPSVSAQMICKSEVRGEIEQLLGVKTTAPLAPSWKDHVYSCRYVYKGGVMTLSVKELADRAQTDAYFASLGTKLGMHEKINGLGQGAFTTKDLSAVVRKDYKVLTVDISGLPAEFGTPPDTRADIALNVASTIMGCWTGA